MTIMLAFNEITTAINIPIIKLYLFKFSLFNVSMKYKATDIAEYAYNSTKLPSSKKYIKFIFIKKFSTHASFSMFFV